jgi:hypothetical protein
VVPNLVAEFEARSSAQNDILRPHENTGLSIPPLSSRQVPKDSSSQDFPTVVPAALSSDSSAKVLLPINSNVNFISLERPSTFTNQKEKLHKDLPPNSMPSQQLQGDPAKTIRLARVDNGKYYQPHIPNTAQLQRIPHPEKRLEENPDWATQTMPRSEPAVSHGASSNRALRPVDAVPSTILQHAVPPDDPYIGLPSSRDERSGGKVSEDASGTGHDAKPREIQPDFPQFVRSSPQADVLRQVVLDPKPLTVREHKAGHGRPSVLEIRIFIEPSNWNTRFTR